MKFRWRGSSGSKLSAFGQRFGPDQNGCPDVVNCVIERRYEAIVSGDRDCNSGAPVATTCM